MATLTLNVNGSPREVAGDLSQPLVFVLRNQLGLTGAKLGCGLEQCGACAVLVDGERVLSCNRPVAEFDGAEVVTVEALGEDAAGAQVQAAFIAEGAAHCGYCTPGLVVAATALLKANPSPAEDDIRGALDDHLCRCGSHGSVLAAVRRAAREVSGA